MTDHKRTYSQRGDDYLIEAQRVCGEDKPAPRCPYCGEKMRESGGISHCWYMCPYCLSAGPRKIIDVTGYPNEELAVIDATQKAREAAMKRWQEPNRVLTMNELREHCKQGADAAPLWVEFHNVPSVSRWMVVYKPEGVFAIDMVQYYLTSFDDGYDRAWRCWLRKPSAEEMSTTPWREK